jgi:hypothetical protein
MKTNTKRKEKEKNIQIATHKPHKIKTYHAIVYFSRKGRCKTNNAFIAILDILYI